MTEIPQFHTLAEAAALLAEHGLKISERSLKGKVQKGTIPHTRMGNRIHLSDAHLDQIIAMHTHLPKDATQLRPAGARRAS